MAAFLLANKRSSFMLGKIKKLLCVDNIHHLFLILALPFAFSYVFTVFPLQSNDEWGHFLRSMDVTYGNITDFESIDTGLHIPKIEAPVSVIPFITNKSVSVDAFESSEAFNSIRDLKNLKWSNEVVRLTDPFAVYPPFSYTFSAVGTLVGKLSDATYAKTLYLGRLTNCLFSIICFYLAIMIASRGKLYLFLILTIPSTLSLISSYSQDAFLISIAALTTSLITRIYTEKDKVYIYLASLGLMLIVLIRPHYFPLLIFYVSFLLFKKVSLKKVVFVFLFVLIPSISWYLYVSPIMVKKMFPGVDEALQLEYVFHNPSHFISMFFESYKELWRKFFIPYISVNKDLYNFWQPVIAFTMLFLFTLSLIKGVHDRKDGIFIGLLIVCLIASMLLIELTAYISWTPVKQTFIAGLQGRYFLPIIMFMALIPLNLKEGDLSNSKFYFPAFVLTVAVLFFSNVSSLLYVTTYYVYR